MKLYISAYFIIGIIITVFQFKKKTKDLKRLQSDAELFITNKSFHILMVVSFMINVFTWPIFIISSKKHQ